MKTLVISAIIASVTASASFAAWDNDNTTTWGVSTGSMFSAGCKF